MPQLISHRDGFGWQTPNAADILEQLEERRDQTGQLRINATVMIRRLAQLGAPVRLRKLEAFASHSRYHLQPDRTGSRGNERPVSIEDLKNALVQLVSELNMQAYELIKTSASDPGITLFLRDASNHPLNLRSLMTQQAFLEKTGYTWLVCGANLEQQPVLRDLNEQRNMLVVGSSNARLHLQMGIALTLMLFNSPAYLRVAAVGDPTSAFRHLIGSPHLLGGIIPTTSDFKRLLDGLIKHLSQRKRAFEKQLVDNINDFNRQAISDKDLKPLPRIVVLLDTVALPDWRSLQADWQVPLLQLLTRGADYGVHLIIATPDDYSLPERINTLFKEFIIMRSALGRFENRVTAPSNVPLQFIDGLLITRQGGGVTPLEMAAVAETEVIRAVTYWLNMKARHDAETQTKTGKIPSGNTGLLTLRDDMMPTPPPIVAEKPNESDAPPIIPDRMVAAAQALAAYLGWLGMGPLHDILGLTADESAETLRILRAIGVLEAGDGPIWRFVKLADAPEGE